MCMQKFPAATSGSLGIAVNGKLTELRSKLKNKSTKAVDDDTE